MSKRFWKRARRNREKYGYYQTGLGMLTSRLQDLGFKKYSEYLATQHWKDLRSKLLPEGTRCSACEDELARNLHHRTYARLGNELPEDLIPLCEKCHTRVHQSERMGKEGGLEGALKSITQSNLRRKRRKERERKKALKLQRKAEGP